VKFIGDDADDKFNNRFLRYLSSPFGYLAAAHINALALKYRRRVK